jgi:hypothetical protein
MCQDISVVVATGFGLDGQSSIPGRDKWYFSSPSWTVLRPTQPPIQRVSRTLSFGLSGRGAKLTIHIHLLSKSKIVSQWLRPRFGLTIGFIGYLQVVITNNYNTIVDLHNKQSLHTNLLSLFPLVLTDLWHRNYKCVTKSHSPNITVLQHT